jgi:hypothetical protein
MPLIDHVVVVVLENHSFDQKVDPHRAPFIRLSIIWRRMVEAQIWRPYDFFD